MLNPVHHGRSRQIFGQQNQSFQPQQIVALLVSKHLRERAETAAADGICSRKRKRVDAIAMTRNVDIMFMWR